MSKQHPALKKVEPGTPSDAAPCPPRVSSEAGAGRRNNQATLFTCSHTIGWSCYEGEEWRESAGGGGEGRGEKGGARRGGKRKGPK